MVSRIVRRIVLLKISGQLARQAAKDLMGSDQSGVEGKIAVVACGAGSRIFVRIRLV